MSPETRRNIIDPPESSRRSLTVRPRSEGTVPISVAPDHRAMAIVEVTRRGRFVHVWLIPADRHPRRGDPRAPGTGPPGRPAPLRPAARDAQLDDPDAALLRLRARR